MSKPAKERLLTPRQEQVVGLAAQVYATKQLPKNSASAQVKVKVHLHNAFEKLGVKSRWSLVNTHAIDAKESGLRANRTKSVKPTGVAASAH